jgi:hypothetical protein
MSKIGLAAAFHHYDEDGAFIPASRLVEGGPFDGQVAPLIGAIVAWDGHAATWGFIKYEAPRIFPRYEGGAWVIDPRKPNRAANVATTRVGTVHCSVCGQSVKTPVKGCRDEKVKCPLCGADRTSVAVVKENSHEFDEMFGDIKDAMLGYAKTAAAEDVPFQFPLVVCGSSTLKPGDSLVPPDAQGIAQSHGRALVALRSMAGGLNDLVNAGTDDDTDLSIIPGIYYGSMSEEEVRNGATWGEGAAGFYLRMRLPEKKRCAPFHSFRY